LTDECLIPGVRYTLIAVVLQENTMVHVTAF